MDILSSIKHEIREEVLKPALQGMEPFCYRYFEEIMEGGVHLISGNRCDFKKVINVGQFLFDFDDGRIRKHWEDRPFRKLYRRARTGLGMQTQANRLADPFMKQVWRKLYAYHWILPYPCTQVLLQKTKEGRRMWYSIDTNVVRAEGLQWVKTEEWTWAKKGWREGRPAELPGYTG